MRVRTTIGVLPRSPAGGTVLHVRTPLPPISFSGEAPTLDDRLLWALWLSPTWLPSVTAADELGLFDRLSDGNPATAEQLAASLELAPRATRALLGLLSALGLLQQQAGTFALTETSRAYLVSSSPFYWGPAMVPHKVVPMSHGQILEALRRDQAGGNTDAAAMWKAPEPAVLRMFTSVMHAHSLPTASALARHEVFAGAHRLLDVGGGSGAYSVSFALRHPALKCTILELPAMIPITDEYLGATPTGGRVKSHGADMFNDAWPAGHDAVFFNDVFHDWPHAQCQALARKAFDGLPSGGKVLLHEMLLDAGLDGPLPAAAYSMMMLVATPGRQLSGPEAIALLAEAGFVETKILPTVGHYSLVSGRKP
jgi:hypothetical protein